MSKLNVTLIDVGWGDSIFIESITDNSRYFALIDSNDTTYNRSSLIFLKKYFEREKIDFNNNEYLFEFILLSHVHSDHGTGLKEIIRKFGTKQCWYPKSNNWGSRVNLLKYCNRPTSKVIHHQSIDKSKKFNPMGNVKINVLWPYHNQIDQKNENNNSVVMMLTLMEVTFLLTGDAEIDAWKNISNKIPINTQFFKVPHHGSLDATLDKNGKAYWLNNCPKNAKLGISCHNTPREFPNSQVIQLFNNNNKEYFRTDQHYHITFSTDGKTTTVKYSH